MVYAFLGFCVFIAWGGFAFAAGIRVGIRRGTVVQFVRPGQADLGNTVARQPQQPVAASEVSTVSTEPRQ